MKRRLNSYWQLHLHIERDSADKGGYALVVRNDCEVEVAQRESCYRKKRTLGNMPSPEVGYGPRLSLRDNVYGVLKQTISSQSKIL